MRVGDLVEAARKGDVAETFAQLDTDANGKLDVNELKRLLPEQRNNRLLEVARLEKLEPVDRAIYAENSLRLDAAPKKISPIATALLLGLPIVFGLCVSYFLSRAVKRLRGDYMLGVFPKDARGLKASVLLADPKKQKDIVNAELLHRNGLSDEAKHMNYIRKSHTLVGGEHDKKHKIERRKSRQLISKKTFYRFGYWRGLHITSKPCSKF